MLAITSHAPSSYVVCCASSGVYNCAICQYCSVLLNNYILFMSCYAVQTEESGSDSAKDTSPALTDSSTNPV